MPSLFNGQKAAKRPKQHEAIRELISYMETTKLYNVIGSSSSDITKWKEAEYACCGDRDMIDWSSRQFANVEILDNLVEEWIIIA